MIFLVMIFATLSILFYGMWRSACKRCAVAEAQVKTLVDSAQISAEKSTEDTEQVHTATHSANRAQRTITPLDYYALFEANELGRKVLEDLTGRFCHLPYVQGGLEADRESCYRAGQFRVVNFINARIGASHQPQYSENDND